MNHSNLIIEASFIERVVSGTCQDETHRFIAGVIHPSILLGLRGEGAELSLFPFTVSQSN